MQVLADHGLDVLLVVAAVVSTATTLVRDDLQTSSDVVRWMEALAVGLVVAAPVLRRSQPFLAPVGTWLGSAALSFVDGRLIVSQASVFLAGMVAAVLLGNLPDARQSRAGLVSVLVGSTVIVFNNPLGEVGDFVFIPLVFGTGWLIGYAFRERAAKAEAAELRASQAELEQELAARVAVAEERSRIARELHDVVAHAVSVMVLQVGAVRHRLPEQLAEDREALRNVEAAGRNALAEMRTLLGALRSDDEEAALAPSPTLSALDRLAADVANAGLEVEVDVEGTPVQLPHALDLTAYRIIQEGLTNVLKHANATQAVVTVRYLPTELDLEVRDNGTGHGSGGGGGHGLLGVGERVKVFGGRLSYGPSDGGGFALWTSLPLARTS